MWLYLDTFDQLPTAKSTPTVKEFFSVRCTKDQLIELQSGMTFEALVESNSYHAPLTCYTEDSLARTSALQDMESAWRESEAGFIGRSTAWPKKSSPNLYSLKTYPQSVPKEAGMSYHRLPKWGMIADGVLFPLHPLERFIAGKDGSYWLTPSTMDTLPVRTGKALDYVMRRGGTSYRKTAGRLNEQVAYPQMWPTPRARDAREEGLKSGMNRQSPSLPTIAKMWPTPDAHARGCRKKIEGTSMTIQNGHHFTIQDAVGSGKLNPMWVEWLMGYPSGWSELSPWATAWFLSRRKRRSKH